MKYERVIEIIDEEWYKMLNLESSFRTIRECSSCDYEEVLEAIKDYVQFCTDETTYKQYTDEDYIKEFLKDSILCSLHDDRLINLMNYTEVMYNLFNCSC